MGLNPASKGVIELNGEQIHRYPTYTIAQKGIGYVPEDQALSALTVKENMKVAIKKKNEETSERQDYILDFVPDLKKYWKRNGGLLSGGQKQMLSNSRAYVNNNKLLLIDEPSKGLASIMVEKVMESILQMKKTTIVLVEQNFRMASDKGTISILLMTAKLCKMAR